MNEKWSYLGKLLFWEAFKLLQLICNAMMLNYAIRIGGISGIICGTILVITMVCDLVMLGYDVVAFAMGRMEAKETMTEQMDELYEQMAKDLKELGEESVKMKGENEK